MRIRKRKKIPGGSIVLLPGDTISCNYKGYDDRGRYKDTRLIADKIDRRIVVDEVVIFDVDEGDIPGIRDGIGGAFCELP